MRDACFIVFRDLYSSQQYHDGSDRAARNSHEKVECGIVESEGIVLSVYHESRMKATYSQIILASSKFI